MTATATQPVPVLLPMYGFPGSHNTQPVPGPHSDQFTVGHLVEVMARNIRSERDRTLFHALRDPATPRPANAFNVVLLTGGRHQYYRNAARSNRRHPWLSRVVDGLRDSYVVWGRPGKEGPKIFDPNRPARTSSGRGSIYTRWPAFNEHGQLTGYGWEVVHVEFLTLTNRPELGEKLRLTIANRRSGQAELGRAKDHDHLLGYNDDELWNELDRRAKAGFDATCTDHLDRDTDKWLTWFLKQKAMLGTAEADRFRYTCRRMGWAQAMDHAIEAWQLAIALSAWSHLFPEVVPSLDLPSDPRQVDLPGYIRPVPYEGTVGGMESRLLEAYLKGRPDRRETLEKWMADYVILLSGIRNYTGD